MLSETAAGESGPASIIDEYISWSKYDILNSWGSCAFYTRDFMEFCSATGKSCSAVYMPLALSHHPPSDPEDHIAPMISGTIIDFAKVPGRGVSKHDRSGRPPDLNPGHSDDSWPRISPYSPSLFIEGGLYGNMGYLKGTEYSNDGWHLTEFTSLKSGKYPVILNTLPSWMQFQEPQVKRTSTQAHKKASRER